MDHLAQTDEQCLTVIALLEWMGVDDSSQVYFDYTTVYHWLHGTDLPPDH
jgi:hypothetical protein